MKGLSLVSLLNDLASEAVYPLLPAFVTGTLRSGPLALGVLDGAADLVSSVLRWVSGRLADRRGWRSPLIVAGYGVAAIVRPLIAAAAAAWHVIALRLLDRVGKGLRSPARDALIADVTPESHHGRAFGFNRAADHIGAVLGSLAAFVLLGLGLSERQIIAGSVLPGALAMIVLVVVLAATRRTAGRAVDPAAPASQAPTRMKALVALGILGGARIPETLLMLRVRDLGVAAGAIPLLWALLHVVRSSSAYAAGIAADRVGAVTTLVSGSALYAVGLALLSVQVGDAATIVTFLGLGIAFGLLEPAERILVARAGGLQRGRAFGTYQSLVGVCSLVTGVLIGAVYQRTGGPIAFMVGAALTVVALVGWWMQQDRTTSAQRRRA